MLRSCVRTVSASGVVEGVGAEGHRAQSVPSVIGVSPFSTLDGSTETLRRPDPLCDQDVARYTALFIPRSAVGVMAMTRLVPLRALLGQRPWPDQATLLKNIVAYGKSHGAWDDADGYCEGSLGRVVEAAAGTPRLPSVKHTPGFLCGMEFDTLAAELSFFTSLGLDLGAVQLEVPLRPGDLLVFDNLALAHGRRGSRRPGELHQRVYGCRSLSSADQCAPRERFLAAFGARQLAPAM